MEILLRVKIAPKKDFYELPYLGSRETLFLHELNEQFNYVADPDSIAQDIQDILHRHLEHDFIWVEEVLAVDE